VGSLYRRTLRTETGSLREGLRPLFCSPPGKYVRTVFHPISTIRLFNSTAAKNRQPEKESELRATKVAEERVYHLLTRNGAGHHVQGLGENSHAKKTRSPT
jgi:hypothetical protein